MNPLLNLSNDVIRILRIWNKNRANWESRIDEYQERMIDSLNKIHNPNEVIEEAKAESEEDSSSNKLSSFNDTSSDDYSFSDVPDIEDSGFEKKEGDDKKLSINKQQSAIDKRKSSFLDLA